MKNLFHHITFSIVLLLVFSCNNDFLKDELDYVSPEYASIIISPDWDSQDYTIYCPNVGNAKYTVIKVPEWLKISSPSGQFTDGFATLNCKAIINDNFSEVGLYYAYMTLAVEGKGNRTIIIAYIIEGNPVINAKLTYDSSYNGRISVKNTGYGILFFYILKNPEWLLLTDQYNATIENYSVIVLRPNGEENIYFYYNSTTFISEKLFGKIVIESNDKNKPILELEVQMDLGNL